MGQPEPLYRFENPEAHISLAKGPVKSIVALSVNSAYGIAFAIVGQNTGSRAPNVIVGHLDDDNGRNVESRVLFVLPFLKQGFETASAYFLYDKAYEGSCERALLAFKNAGVAFTDLQAECGTRTMAVRLKDGALLRHDQWKKYEKAVLTNRAKKLVDCHLETPRFTHKNQLVHHWGFSLEEAGRFGKGDFVYCPLMLAVNLAKKSSVKAQIAVPVL